MLPTIEKLEKRRASLIQYLLSKVDANDWHGVADAAMDLREIDAQLVLLEEMEIQNQSENDKQSIEHIQLLKAYEAQRK